VQSLRDEHPRFRRAVSQVFHCSPVPDVTDAVGNVASGPPKWRCVHCGATSDARTMVATTPEAGSSSPAGQYGMVVCQVGDPFSVSVDHCCSSVRVVAVAV
jgi:hypothetical protein